MTAEEFTLTMDELVAFAQQGWHWPLNDTPEIRDEIRTTVGQIKSGDADLDWWPTYG